MEMKSLNLNGKIYDSFVDKEAREKSATVDLDTTLSVEGKAADAKAVGDALAAYITDIDALVGGDG